VGDHPFLPDWTLAPVELLREWLTEHPDSPLTDKMPVAGLVPGPPGMNLLEDLCARRPLGQPHASFLELWTGIPAAMWLSYETNYRADLARGAKDVTDA
jgi:hypothetical protein